MKQKKRTNNSSKGICNWSVNYVPMSPEWNKIALLKSARFNLHRKSFFKDLLKQTNDENQTGKVWLL